MVVPGLIRWITGGDIRRHQHLHFSVPQALQHLAALALAQNERVAGFVYIGTAKERQDELLRQGLEAIPAAGDQRERAALGGGVEREPTGGGHVAARIAAP